MDANVNIQFKINIIASVPNSNTRNTKIIFKKKTGIHHNIKLTITQRMLYTLGNVIVSFFVKKNKRKISKN